MGDVRSLEGTEPAHQVVALGSACTLTALVLDQLISPGLGIVFDLGFVVLCAAIAFLVRQRDFFTVGVLPPLLMLGVFVLVGLLEPAVLTEPGDTVLAAVIGGLAHHAPALFVGYVLALAVLAFRGRRNDLVTGR